MHSQVNTSNYEELLFSPLNGTPGTPRELLNKTTTNASFQQTSPKNFLNFSGSSRNSQGKRRVRIIRKNPVKGLWCSRLLKWENVKKAPETELSTDDDPSFQSFDMQDIIESDCWEMGESGRKILESLRSKDTKIANLNSQLEDIKIKHGQEVEIYKEQLTKSQSKYDKLAQDYSQALSIIEQLTESNHQLQERLTEYEHFNNGMVARYNQSQASVSTLQIKKLEEDALRFAESAQWQSVVDKLKKQLAEEKVISQQMLKQLEVKLRDSYFKIKNLTEESAKQYKQVNDLTIKYAHAQDQLKSMEQQVSRLQIKVLQKKQSNLCLKTKMLGPNKRPRLTRVRIEGFSVGEAPMSTRYGM